MIDMSKNRLCAKNSLQAHLVKATLFTKLVILLNLNIPSQQDRDYPHLNPTFMVFEFSPGERLRQNICITIFCGNVLKQHDPSLRTISEMMVPDIYMLGPIMKHKINREFNATLIIIKNHCRIHLGTKQTNQDISHPDSLTFNLICCHVFRFR